MLCRLCLKNNTPLHNIINTDLKCAELSLIESLYWVFGVEVDVNDPHSKYICTRCENVVQYVGSYRTLYRRNQLLLEQNFQCEDDYDQWIDSVEVNGVAGHEQIMDTGAKCTPSKSKLSPREKKRLELIKYYYEVPTSAIRDLIANRKANNVKNDDAPLFQVNEIVTVEVCKYCSKIFKSKPLLEFHYRMRHKSGEKTNSHFKRRKTKKVTLLQKHQRRKILSKQLAEKRAIISRLDIRKSQQKKVLFDVKNFPNLNFVKQLDGVKNGGESQTLGDHDYSISADLDIGENNETINKDKSLVTLEIKTVKISECNEKTISAQYKSLALKDFAICLQRCAAPIDFYEITRNVEQDVVNLATESSDETPVNKNEHFLMEATKKTSEHTIIKDKILRIQHILKRLDNENSEAGTQAPLHCDDASEINEDPGTVNIDDSSDEVESVWSNNDDDVEDSCFIEEDVSKQKKDMPELNIRDLYVSIVRCKVPTSSVVSGNNQSVDKLNGTEQNNETLLEQHINSREKEGRSTITAIDLGTRPKDSNKRTESTSLKGIKGNLSRNKTNSKNLNSKDVYNSQQMQRNRPSSCGGLSKEIDISEQLENEEITPLVTRLARKKQLKRKHNEQDQIELLPTTKRHRKRAEENYAATNLDKVIAASNLRKLEIVIPKISIPSKKGNKVVQQTPELELSPVPQNSSDRMPQLEKQNERVIGPPPEGLDEPPKLELQVQKETNEMVVNQATSLTSKPRSSSPTKRKKSRTLKSKHRRKTVDYSTLREKIQPIAPEVEQLITALKLMELKASEFESDWINKRVEFEGLPINNWKERVFRKDQSVDNEDYLQNESHLVVQEISNTVADDKDHTIKEKSPHLDKESEGGNNTINSTDSHVHPCLKQKDIEYGDNLSDADESEDEKSVKMWRRHILDVLLKLKSIEENNRPGEENRGEPEEVQNHVAENVTLPTSSAEESDDVDDRIVPEQAKTSTNALTLQSVIKSRWSHLTKGKNLHAILPK